jgi:hypothetical protein
VGRGDPLFRNDDRWLGGDCAASSISGRQVLSLGDSFIAGYSRDRRSAVVVRNTVAVQRGTTRPCIRRVYWSSSM